MVKDYDKDNLIVIKCIFFILRQLANSIVSKQAATQIRTLLVRLHSWVHLPSLVATPIGC